MDIEIDHSDDLQKQWDFFVHDSKLWPLLTEVGGGVESIRFVVLAHPCTSRSCSRRATPVRPSVFRHYTIDQMQLAFASALQFQAFTAACQETQKTAMTATCMTNLTLTSRSFVGAARLL